ncbi:hypothetical protein Tco_0940709 [Tanacetum coccineum]|uniref:Uncharacterized protein n=1 Tax=Tanacetum coccineum TaxID=301880 RepID=A0ABQ5DUU2_9ASTR
MKNLSQKANESRDLSRSLQLSQHQVSSSERLWWKQSLKERKKEKVDVAHGKGIDLLSEVALTEKAQLKEVRKKSLRDFNKTHPSGSGTVAEKPPSVEKITPTITSEGTCDKPGVPAVAEDDSTKSDSNEQENECKEQESDDLEQEDESDDDDQEDEESVHTPSLTDDKDDENLELESDEVIKSDEEKGLDDTDYQFNDDVDARLKEPTQTDKEVVQETDLASKFLNFSDIPHTVVEIVSPLDVHVYHEVPRTQAPTLLTIPVSVITESSPVYTKIPQSSQTFTPLPILTTPTPPLTIETTNPLSTLPDFALVFRFNDRITALEKEITELKKDPLHT